MYASFFVFKQKTAYEMRISDWSSDVCSSDLEVGQHGQLHARLAEAREHLLDVAEEEPVGANHQDALALEREAVRVEQVGGAVKGDDGLAGARTALHHQHAGQLGADDLVLLALDGCDDVAQAAGADLLERGDEGGLPADLTALVDDRQLAAEQPRRFAEQLVLDGQELPAAGGEVATPRSEEHTSELQSLMRISYAGFCLK